MAMIRVPLVRCSNEPDSSSMAKTIPARGALNAAETPAAPPATIRELSTYFWLSRPTRPTEYIIAAPMCTLGPSRPILAPHSNPRQVSTNLLRITRKDRKAGRNQW